MLTEGLEPIPGYRLKKFLGRGQFGEVWQASSPGGTQVALKFLNVRERQGRKEFRAIQKVKGIRHPHLVQTYALWLLDENMNVIDDALFDADQSFMADSIHGTLVHTPIKEDLKQKPSGLVIATVLCDQNLMEVLHKYQAEGLPGIPVQELIGYMDDAAKAIDFLNSPRHELGDGAVAIHHCDIKPENIMVVGDLAVVGDFGVARILRSGGSENRSTTMGGTIAYSPPETFDNRTESTSDQYALAITYFELRTGKLPFPEDSSAQQVMKDKITGSLNFSDVPAEEAKILRKATSVDPNKRYPTARAFVEELQRANGGKAALPSRSKWAIPSTIFTATLCGVAIFLAVQNGSEKTVPIIPPPPPPPNWEEMYQQAMNDYLASDRSEIALAAGLETAKKAIEEGKYEPSQIVWDGSEMNETNLGPDERREMDYFAISTDEQAIVKVHNGNTKGSHAISFISLSETKEPQKIVLEGSDKIQKVTWISNSLFVLDNKGSLFRIPQTDELFATSSLSLGNPLKPLTGRASNAKFSHIDLSGNYQRLILLANEPGKRRGVLVEEPNRHFVLEFKTDDELSILNDSTSLKWQDLDTFISTDLEGNFVCTGDRSEESKKSLFILDCVSKTLTDISDAPGLSQISKIENTSFFDTNGTFFIWGYSMDREQEYSISLARRMEDHWQVEPFPVRTTAQISAILPESQDTCLIAQESTICRYVLTEGKQESESSEEIVDFCTLSDCNVGKINALRFLDPKWLITGHETGETRVVYIGAPSTSLSLPLCSRPEVLDSEVRDIRVVGGKIVVFHTNGCVVWYELSKVLFAAEACRESNVKPTSASTTSFKS